jgi:hypothetical protein
MSTSPSGQDDDQLLELAESCGDFFIRGILNKSGRMEFTIYLISLRLIVSDVAWEIHQPDVDLARRNRWKEEVEKKVSDMPTLGYHGEDGEERWYPREIEAVEVLVKSGFVPSPARIRPLEEISSD